MRWWWCLLCSKHIQRVGSHSASSLYSVGNHFFLNTRQNGEWTETKTRQNEIELAMSWRATFFFKLANKYQINNTVMFNNLFCRFWQVIIWLTWSRRINTLLRAALISSSSISSSLSSSTEEKTFYALMHSIKHACQSSDTYLTLCFRVVFRYKFVWNILKQNYFICIHFKSLFAMKQYFI
jgi:hypothetical protein